MPGWECGCAQEHGWPGAWVLGAVPLETVMHGLCPKSGVGGMSPVRSMGRAFVIAMVGPAVLHVGFGPEAGLLSWYTGAQGDSCIL